MNGSLKVTFDRFLVGYNTLFIDYIFLLGLMFCAFESILDFSFVIETEFVIGIGDYLRLAPGVFSAFVCSSFFATN